MRRSIQVYGVETESGKVYTTENDNILSIYANPDKTATITYTNGKEVLIEDKWVRYSPRYN